MTQEHSVIRAVSGDDLSGWTVSFQCRACAWSSEATAPTVAEAQSVQLEAKNRHLDEGGVAGSLHDGYGAPYEQVGPYQEESGCCGCIVLVIGVLLLLGLLSSCLGLGDDDDDGSSKYTEQECVALQISGISGDDDSLIEYSTYCD